MNLNDPRNVILTIPQGFDFDLLEYEKSLGCKLEVLNITLSDTDNVVNHVTEYALKYGGLTIRVKSWLPLLLEKKLTIDGEEIWEGFSILALRIVGELNQLKIAKGQKRLNNVIEYKN